MSGDARPPTRHKTRHATGGSDALTGNLDANARVAVAKAGAGPFTRRKLLVVDTLGISVTIADDAPGEQVTITPAVTGKFPDNIVLPKTSGKGIQVDTTTPTFPWRDILGAEVTGSPGANDPTWATFRNGIKGWQFGNIVINERWFMFHVPHDYLPGSDLFVHAHWSQAVVDTGGAGGTPGVVKWVVEHMAAKGHNQAAYPAGKLVTLSEQASAVQYQHMLIEAQLSSAGGSASLMDTASIEPDMLVLCRVFRDPADPVNTLNQGPFLLEVDVHYQSTNIGTKQRAPNFYV